MTATLLVAVLVASSAVAAGLPAAGVARPEPQWSWPVGPGHRVVRPFLAPETRYSAGHRGIDIAAESGAPVAAPADGVVHFAGIVVDRGVVSIRHPDGLISSVEPVTATVAEGDVVARGSPIGVLSPGHCATPCLHFGVRLNGEYVSPLNYLGGIPPSVLLPTRR